MIQSIDQVALLPAYAAAGTAVAVFVADLVAPKRAVSLTLGVLGCLAVVAAAVTVPKSKTFCSPQGCSYVFDRPAMVLAVVFAALTAGVFLLSARAAKPAGEYTFLLACSLTGGVLLGASRDLITLVVALETLTLPLYALVALRRDRRSAEGAVTLFVVSVIATAVTLLGAALLYATTGAVHFGALAAADVHGQLKPLYTVAAGLLVVGLAFKVAAVPLHGWAPPTYDGAPLPVAAYLSTASKLGGVVALFYVTSFLHVGVLLAGLAVATMTVGNLGALRQKRMVRLLAWSSVAQAGYILAALVVSGPAAVAYAIFFVLMELGAFGAVIGLRGKAADGGTLDDYRGAARRSPWLAGALVLALAGLAGLPPGFAGLFAKLTVIQALVGGGYGWLAVLVALNAVLALAYYLKVGASLFAVGSGDREERDAPIWAAVALASVAALIVGFAPQLILDAAKLTVTF